MKLLSNNNYFSQVLTLEFEINSAITGIEHFIQRCKRKVPIKPRGGGAIKFDNVHMRDKKTNKKVGFSWQSVSDACDMFRGPKSVFEKYWYLKFSLTLNLGHMLLISLQLVQG